MAESLWALEAEELITRLGTRPEGLSTKEAERRLEQAGPNVLVPQAAASLGEVLWSQLQSPLLLLLLFAAGASALTREWLDASIVLVIVLATVGIGSSREYSAQKALAALRARITTRAEVLRDGGTRELPVEQLVPGDIVLLSAGSLVPADCVLLEGTDCYVAEAALTGESFPVEKRPQPVAADAPLAERKNCLYLGTNVRSGTARCVVMATGTSTQFGAIAHRLSLRPPETEFDRGVRHFGYLLTYAMLMITLCVFAANTIGGRPPIETLLFSIALAVGLSPELLPAILSINLSRGAQEMAERGVLVRRLNAIENLGTIDVLCTDKTGTLTEGVVRLEGAFDPRGRPHPRPLELAAINAALETGLHSPLDDAILEAHAPALANVRKLAEVPFDFVRKRVSVVVKRDGGVLLVTKGAVRTVLDACAFDAQGSPLDGALRAEIEAAFDAWSEEGMRVIAVATRVLASDGDIGREQERELRFEGFLAFHDRPKPGVREAVENLGKLGVSIKLITGDAKLSARHVARQVGLGTERILTGKELDELHDEALWQAAEHTELFVEVDPNQKERIILALKKTGHVVGFLGDGVNDAPAMHAADTSLSVDSAVDVAREAADFVLLERDLSVIQRGIEAGRRTFANTLKYILTTTSANLGNMISMAVGSLFLPFLPLLAGQVLLNNFLSDVPAVGVADDAVDPELVALPRRWNMRFIARFMTVFGVLSSLFDLLTFALLLWLFHVSMEEFRTGWFVESLLTELWVALVVRTRRPFYRSRPGRLLATTTLVVFLLTLAIPFVPGVEVLGFVALPASVLLTLLLVAVAYVLVTELVKRRFYRGEDGDLATPHARPAGSTKHA